VNGVASLAIDFGVVFYEYLRVIVAFIAVVLAVKWKRNEFLAGLFFLFLWSFLDAVYVTFSTLLDESFINVSQFGFIMLALVCFILGMRPATSIEAPFT
jgi:hypothetical protein